MKKKKMILIGYQEIKIHLIKAVIIIINLKPLSDDFKELFIKMVESNPKKRITLDEIMDSKWMKDIKNASKEYLEMLRNKMISEM